VRGRARSSSGSGVAARKQPRRLRSHGRQHSADAHRNSASVLHAVHRRTDREPEIVKRVVWRCTTLSRRCASHSRQQLRASACQRVQRQRHEGCGGAHLLRELACAAGALSTQSCDALSAQRCGRSGHARLHAAAVGRHGRVAALAPARCASDAGAISSDTAPILRTTDGTRSPTCAPGAAGGPF
jgi:hypothetical protein